MTRCSRLVLASCWWRATALCVRGGGEEEQGRRGVVGEPRATPTSNAALLIARHARPRPPHHPHLHAGRAEARLLQQVVHDRGARLLRLLRCGGLLLHGRAHRPPAGTDHSAGAPACGARTLGQHDGPLVGCCVEPGPCLPTIDSRADPRPKRSVRGFDHRILFNSLSLQTCAGPLLQLRVRTPLRSI
jgi:hypothetical protein